MAEEDLQERNEEASAKKLLDAREKGQVPRSRELNTLGVLLAGGGSLALLGPSMLEDVTEVMRAAFQPEPVQYQNVDGIMSTFMESVQGALVGLAPFLLVMFVVAALVPMALGGFNISAKALAFQWERMDPIKGLKRIFSIKGLVELFKSLAKFAFMGAVGGTWLWFSANEYMALGLSPLGGGLADGADFVVLAFLISVSPMIAVAAIDVPFQLWDHARQLRMSRRELKDEHKETDGNPELKAKLRQQQQQVAHRRMMAAVPEADVIITNPTHYSVALKYSNRANGAPVLVAAGVDLMAMRIREVGAAHAVPQVRSPLLARAIYFNTKLDKEIPTDLYIGVAKVLAYVYRLRREGFAQYRPIEMEDAQIPDGLRTE